jgi:hypothetical protein
MSRLGVNTPEEDVKNELIEHGFRLPQVNNKTGPT